MAAVSGATGSLARRERFAKLARRTAIRLADIALIAVIGCFILGAASGAVRSAYLLWIARVWAPAYALAGDSTTRNCQWVGRLAWNPFAILNLAESGRVTREIAAQVRTAKRRGAGAVLIAAGINDLIQDDAPTDVIAFDFDILLRSLGREQRAIVTLIPYTSDSALSPRIDAANTSIRRLAEQRNIAVIDLNPALSENRVRKPEMTFDGIHFTDRACAVWLDLLKKQLSETAASKPL
jgi:lysophospholipase L1-like esterase